MGLQEDRQTVGGVRLGDEAYLKEAFLRLEDFMDERILAILKNAMLLICDGQEDEANMMVACPPRHAVVTAGDGLNVRQEPNAKGLWVGLLAHGDAVSVWGAIVTDREWTFVINRDAVGWVASEYLAVGN